ncbi:MAG: LamG-like jellyroll fold domain-containing protein [bacterium]|nr:LamG-like jellyroll fold domain-containing protein [bacterium]
MKSNFSWLNWVVLLSGTLALLGLGSCNKPKDRSQYKGHTEYVSVSVNLNKPAGKSFNHGSLRAKESSLPPDTQTSLILAVPGAENFQGNYLGLTQVIDAALLDLNTHQVTLTLPKDTPMRLFEYTFSSRWPSPDAIRTANPPAIAGADLGPITIGTGTVNLVLNSTLVPLTRPSRLEIITTDHFLAIGGTKQLFAIGSYPDGSAQDLTTLVNWTSGSPTIASVSNDLATSKGLVTGLTKGGVLINASVLGTEALYQINVSNLNLSTYYSTMVTSGSYAFDANDDGFGGLEYYAQHTTWQPSYSEDFLVVTDANRTPTPAVRTKVRYVLEGPNWVPDNFVPTAISSDAINSKLSFGSPAGYIQLVGARELGGQVEQVDTNQVTLSVPMGPGAVAYEIEYLLDYGAPQYTIERPEVPKNGTTAYATLEEFLTAGATDPFDCTNNVPNFCLMFDYVAGQTAGNLIEFELDANYNPVGTTSVGGTWSLSTVNGQPILTAIPYNPAFSQNHGPPGDPIWGIYNGQVMRGQIRAPQEYGFFTEYNAAAANSVLAFLGSAPPELFVSPWYNPGGSTGGVTTSIPQGLGFNGAQAIKNSTASLLGITNSFTIGVWFKASSLGPASLVEIQQPGGVVENAITLSTDASGFLAATIQDSVNAASNYAITPTTMPITVGEPHFATLSWDGSVLSVTLDSVDISSTPTVVGTPVLTDIERIVTIGNDSVSTGFSGQIHSVAVWNSTLNLSGLTELSDMGTRAFKDNISFNMTTYNESANLMHWWKFDDQTFGFGGDLGNGVALMLDLGSTGPADLAPYTWVDPTKLVPAAITAPIGSDNLISGQSFNITWNQTNISGNIVRVFLMPVPLDPTWLDQTAADIDARVAAAEWYDLTGGGTSNLGGSYAFDPSGWGYSGHYYHLMVIDELGNWDITDAPFGINDPNAPINVPMGLSFNGTTEHLLSASLTNVFDTAASFSIAVWFNPAVGNTGQQMLVQVSDGSVVNRINLMLDGATNQVILHMQDGTSITEYQSNVTYVPGQENFVAIAWDNATPALTMVLNQSVNPQTTTGTHTGNVSLFDTARQVSIGGDITGATPFQGEILGVGMWSTVLISSEMTGLASEHLGHQLDLATSTTSYYSGGTLSHWWQFDWDPVNQLADMGLGTYPAPVDIGVTNGILNPFLVVNPTAYVDGAFTAPLGGETYTSGVPTNVTWNPASFTGTNLNIYMLGIAANAPMSPTDPNLAEQISSVTKRYLSSATVASGSFSFDPSTYGMPSSSQFRFLIIDDAGNWDLVDGDVFTF